MTTREYEARMEGFETVTEDAASTLQRLTQTMNDADPGNPGAHAMIETSILIAERDSRWTEWARLWRKPQHELVVLVQHAQESQADFFERVRHKFESVIKQGHRLKRVVIAGGSRWDTPSLLARAQMIRATLTRLARSTQPARLWLDTGSKQGSGALGMRAIADAVGQAAAGAGRLLLVSGPLESLAQVT